MWNKFPNTPPNIPETEDFGIDYEVKYNLPNGKIETTITEWLWEKKWNCIYPVIAWREYSPIIPFRHWNDDLLGKEKTNMKNGTHVNVTKVDEITAHRLLNELYQKSKKENNGKVNIRKIEDNHIAETVERY